MKADNSEEILRLEDLTLETGGRQLIAGGNLVIGRGEIVALLGRNGAGKSTLLKAIAGLSDNYRGKIYIMGESHPSPRRRAASMAYVASGRVRVASMRVRDMVALGRSPFTGWTGSMSPSDKELVDKAMEMAGIKDMSARMIDTLSDGEAQRVMIARALAQDSPLIILDEPTSWLDVPSRESLCRLLTILAQLGKGVLFTTHEISLAMKYADTIALITSSRLMSGQPMEMAAIVKEEFSID